MTTLHPKIDVARVYDAPAADGRARVLVDRLWPRGVKKEELQLDAWLKNLGPSTELRQWFHHEPQRWDEFRRRFFKELEAKPDQLEKLRQVIGPRSVLLLYGSRDEVHNNAIALKEFLEKHEIEQKS